MNTKITPKDFFLHLLATGVLYTAVGALITLVFRTIDYSLPDVLAGYFYAPAISWPISILIILVPTYYVVEWFLNRDIHNDPLKKDIWIRRWRIDLTIFLTAVMILGTLITLISTYLNGEISARFVCKVLAILIISAVVFSYYLLERIGYGRESTKKALSYLGIVLVIAAIVGGFVVVGSPTKQRDLRLDSQRVNDLSSIQWQVINHYQQKEALPATLKELNDEISGYLVPKDPVSSEEYSYRIIDANSRKFELCATFARSSEDNKGRGQYGVGYGVSYSTSYPRPYGEDIWDHAAGKVCFERTIDRDRYPIIEKKPTAIY